MNNYIIKTIMFGLILFTIFLSLLELQNNAIQAILSDNESMEYEKLVKLQTQILKKYRITQHELDVFGIKEVANNHGLPENETMILENKMLYDYKKESNESTLCGDKIYKSYEKLLECILFTGN